MPGGHSNTLASVLFLLLLIPIIFYLRPKLLFSDLVFYDEDLYMNVDYDHDEMHRLKRQVNTIIKQKTINTSIANIIKPRNVINHSVHVQPIKKLKGRLQASTINKLTSIRPNSWQTNMNKGNGQRKILEKSSAVKKSENLGAYQETSEKLQNIYGQFEVIRDCCYIPAIIPNQSLAKCSNTFATVKRFPFTAQSLQRGLANTANTAFVGSRIIANGFFGVVRQFLNTALTFGKRRRKRQDETTPDPNSSVDPTGDTTVSVDPTGDTTVSVDPTGDTTVSVDPTGDTTVSVDPTGDTSVSVDPTGDTSVSVDPTGDTTVSVDPTGDTTLSSDSTVSEDPTGSSESSVSSEETPTASSTQASISTPVQQSFTVQTVCYADCVFRDLSLLNTDNTIKLVEALNVFKSTLAFTVGNPDFRTTWENLVNTALNTCIDSVLKALPNRIQLLNGRMCSMRPVLLLTCIRRYMVINCPSVNSNQRCRVYVQQLKNTNLFKVIG